MLEATTIRSLALILDNFSLLIADPISLIEFEWKYLESNPFFYRMHLFYIPLSQVANGSPLKFMTLLDISHTLVLLDGVAQKLQYNKVICKSAPKVNDYINRQISAVLVFTVKLKPVTQKSGAWQSLDAHFHEWSYV